MPCNSCQHYQPSKWRYTETSFGGNLEKATESNPADRGFCWHPKNMADVSASFNCNFYEQSNRILPGKERDETLLERGDGAEWVMPRLQSETTGTIREIPSLEYLAGGRKDGQRQFGGASKRRFKTKAASTKKGGNVGMEQTTGENLGGLFNIG